MMGRGHALDGGRGHHGDFYSRAGGRTETPLRKTRRTYGLNHRQGFFRCPSAIRGDKWRRGIRCLLSHLTTPRYSPWWHTRPPLFLFFLGYTEAYKAFQDRLILREGLMVAFFLAGLVALGGLQQWWLQQALTDVQPTVLYFIATGLDGHHRQRCADLSGVAGARGR